jgi:hypothetical protein
MPAKRVSNARTVRKSTTKPTTAPATDEYEPPIESEPEPQPQDAASPLQAVMANLEQAFTDADQKVKDLRSQLSDAERDLRTLEAIKAVRDGTFTLTAPEPPKPRRQPLGSRLPRSEGRVMAERIIAVVREFGEDGAVVADIIPKVVPSENNTDRQRVRNKLAQMVKAGTMARDGKGFYSVGNP